MRDVRLKVTSEPAHDDVSHVERPMLRHCGECLKSEHTERVSFALYILGLLLLTRDTEHCCMDTSMNAMISVNINLPRLEGYKYIRYTLLSNDPYNY